MTVVSQTAVANPALDPSPGATTVLVVDDEPAVREVLRGFLEMSGYRVFEAGDSSTLYSTLNRESVDLITLDVGLGTENGLDIARELRQCCSCGIIIVSGRGDMVDRVVGLELGADDYIAKPFELREVLARVRSVLRRTAQAAAVRGASSKADTVPESLHFDGYTLIPLQHELVDASGNTCTLTTAEYKLLELFVRHPHQVLSRDQIMDHLHGYDWSPNDRSIDNGVARLRKKLSCESPNGLIKTIRGIGYLFAATVSRR